MATYLQTKMTELADIIRAKTGETGLLSVTSMISTLLREAIIENEGVIPFLERRTTVPDYEADTSRYYYPNSTIVLPVQAVSIGPYAFAYYKGLNKLTQARGIAYKNNAFDYCEIGTSMQNYNTAGGTFSATYDTTPAPARQPNGGPSPDVPEAVRTALLDPARYTGASIDAHFEALASTIRAIDAIADPLTIQSMIDHVSAMTIAGHNYVLAKMIDRTITEADVPEGVTQLGPYALRGCTNLSEVSLPSTLTDVGLDGSTNLGPTTYLAGQFFDCHPTFHLTMYGNTSIFRKICNRPFYCTFVGYPGNSPEQYDSYYEVTNIDGYNGSAYNTVTINDARYVIRSVGTSDDDYGGYQLNASKIDFKNVDIIRDDAFASATMHYVDLRGVKRAICSSAFYSCVNLTSISWPTEQTVDVQARAFIGYPLQRLDLPATVNLAGLSCFAGCNTLSLVSINTSQGAHIGLRSFIDCVNLESVIVTGGATEIGYGCFEGDVKIKYVSLPNTVSRIGMWAFSNAYDLSTFAFPTNLRRIEQEAFVSASLSNINLLNTNISLIGNGAFYGCSYVTSVTLPATVNRVNYAAFGDCPRLAVSAKAISISSDLAGGGIALMGKYNRNAAADVTVSSVKYYAWTNNNATYYTDQYLTTDGDGNPACAFSEDANWYEVYTYTGTSMWCDTKYMYDWWFSTVNCKFPSSVLFDANGHWVSANAGNSRVFYFTT